MGDSNWFLAVPVILVILLNTFFLLSVIRIIKSKIEATGCSNRSSIENSSNNFFSQDFMKQAKAAMFLIPIFGINFLLIPFRPSNDSVYFERVYDVISTLSSSFQGTLVSILLCFTNGQVLQSVKSKLRSQTITNAYMGKNTENNIMAKCTTF